MTARLFIRKFHRYLALVVAVQLFAWSLGGFFFAINPIEEIHGDHLVNHHLKAPPPDCDGVGGLRQIAQQISLAQNPAKTMSTLAGHFWQINTEDGVRWYDFCLGTPSEKLAESEIRSLARQYAKSAGTIESVQIVSKVAPDSEFRERPLPAYRVDFEKENLHLYLEETTGKVLAIRTQRWRIFDFLWMLHVMDYETRDNFNHPLLQFFSLLAVITSLSGIVLWLSTQRKRFPRARTQGKPAD